MSSGRFTRTRGDQIQKEIEREAKSRKRDRIDRAIQAGYKALYEADHHRLALICRDLLMEELSVTRHTFRDHAERVTSDSSLAWNHVKVRRFVENPDRYVQYFATNHALDDATIAREYRRMAEGAPNPTTAFREVIIGTFRSLESLAIATGYVTGKVTNWAPTTGYELQMGILYQPPRGDMPDEVQLVKPGDSEEVTVNMGVPGRGKGMAGHTEIEDRFAAGRKIIDMVDMDECEGAVYDIPQCKPHLREIREEMGLAPDFTEMDNLNPELEIYVPLTRDFEEQYFPFYGPNGEDTVVKPFTVPASSLSKRAIKRFIQSELTDTQEAIFERAYDSVERRYDDWTLTDLAYAVENNPQDNGAGRRVMSLIEKISKQGWIRDRADRWAIDWEDILTNPDVITVFTASKMSDKDLGMKYLLVSYLIYGLRINIKRLKNLPPHEIRDRGWNHVPKITSVFRELHKIAPNNESAEADNKIREVQGAMASDFRDLTAMHRHEGVEIIADTQNFIGEIKARARKNFNRAVLFETQFTPARNMFKEMAGETGKKDKYPRRVKRGFGVGESAVLGRVGTGRPFEMTVAWAPSASYHFDPDDWHNVNTGWDARVQLLGEEYRKGAEIIQAARDDQDADGDADSTVDDHAVDLKEIEAEREKPEEPVGAFAWDHIEKSREGTVIIDNLLTAYHQWARDNEKADVSRQQLSQNLFKYEIWDEASEYHRYTRKSHPDGSRVTPMYEGIQLTKSGEELLERGLEWEKRQEWEDVEPEERDYHTRRVDWDDVILTDDDDGEDADDGDTDVPESVAGTRPEGGDLECCDSPHIQRREMTGLFGEDYTMWWCKACETHYLTMDDGSFATIACCDHPRPAARWKGDMESGGVINGFRCRSCSAMFDRQGEREDTTAAGYSVEDERDGEDTDGDSDPSDAPDAPPVESDGGTVPEDPSSEELSCCANPRPEPWYRPDGETQIGWTCGNCSHHEWTGPQ